MIRVENLKKSFGSQVLFDGINFKLNPRERIGLVGRNGHGKTTLFRLITGQEVPDAGHITVPRHYRIGYVHQEPAFTKDTVLKEGMTGLIREEQDHHWKVEKVLAGLGFSKRDMQRHPQEFSGGFQVRLNLAKVLVSDPDLLLLDEPTNYLDITSIRWVARFLINWPRELMLITHDRGLMDMIVTHTLGIYHRKVRKIVGNTPKFYAQISLEEEVYEKTRIKDERRRKEIEQFIIRFRAKARLANLVQSRIKTLAKAGKKEKLEKLKTLDFSFRSSPFNGKHVMSVRNLSFAYDPQKPLIKDFNITVGRRDRICVVGKNGKGKTTLLKLLSGVLRAQSGEITCHQAVKKGVFEQTNLKTLVDKRTVEEEILFSHSDVDLRLARNICGAMLFEGGAALKKIGVLSGGEKSRVMLGKLLAKPVNLLLLDEPTNHLDMESSDALLAAVDNFEGTVIIVTHNEMFLHTLAERLIVFQKGAVYVFEGGYQRFLEKGGWEDEAEKTESGPKDADKKGSRVKLTKKGMRRRRAELIIERAKILKPLEKSILRTEHDIEKHEKTLDELNAAIQAASQAQDGARIAQLSQSIHRCRSEIDPLFDELEEYTSILEKQKTIFENKMEQLESE
ncbi:MAG: ABC-F family ATP-binding cassette domain-containing protein [Candidatus Desulfatibia sp.]|uniref:ABC-F family ATP-binding cassette domain-containing protein n=1 Tax=Candidatus Desulfatibia sp. TaxID=3101189 RepID=UPI002F2F4DC4